MKQPPMYSVSDVARDVKRTPLRIRQLCNEMNLGVMISGRMRILSESDVRAIRERIKNARVGRPPKKN